MLCILFFCVLCEKKYVILYLSLCHSVLQKSPVSLRHSVILSSKNICLTLSLCHSVFKKTSVSLCHYVILSSKKHLSLSVTLSFCLRKKHLPPFVIMSFCLQKNICLSFSLCHYVGRQRIQNLDKTVQKKQKRGCVYYDTPSFVMLLPRRGNQFSASFSSTFSVFGFWCKTKIMARAMAAVIIPPATQSCPNIASNADMAIRIMTIE